MYEVLYTDRLVSRLIQLGGVLLIVSICSRCASRASLLNAERIRCLNIPTVVNVGV